MSTGPVAGEADATPRRTSLLATEDAEKYPIAPMMTLLCLVALTDGLDGGLFPAVTKALENTVQFEIGTLGFMAMVQFFCQALAGPFWGVLASRAIMTRQQILTLGVLMQGLATMIMWMFIGKNFTMLLILRGINGFSLAALRPIANSIVADRFDDETRGKYFGYVYVCFVLGTGLCQLFATMIGELVLFPSLPTFWGWKLAFLVIGAFTMSLAPAIHFCLRSPLVKVDPNKEKGGVGQELQKIRQLFQIPTFTIIVLQGCFGLIPWRALDFRIFFFQTAGLSNGDASTVAILGGSGNLFGAIAGGFIGDWLNKIWPAHGRVLCAEISVYGGVPLSFMTFFMFPEADAAFWWYFSLTFALGLISVWPSAGCNAPVLCNIVAEDERSLVLAWQVALEGAVGALGPFIFTFLMTNVFDYDVECNKEENQGKPECQNKEAAGMALGYTTCIPWTIAGLLYTSLHYFYPRDLKAIEDRKQQAGLSVLELS